MNEISKALTYTRLGVVGSALMFFYYMLSIFVWKPKVMELENWLFCGLVYLFIGWGIYHKSRGIAIFGLCFYVYDKTAEWFNNFSGNPDFAAAIVDVLFDAVILSGLICGILGTRSYHRLARR